MLLEELDAVLPRLYTDESKLIAEKLTAQAGNLPEDRYQQFLKNFEETCGRGSLADFLMETGKEDEANQIYDELIERNKNTNLGEPAARLAMRLGRYETAKPILEKLIKFSTGEYPRPTEGISYALQLGDVEKAIEIFDKYSDQDSTRGKLPPFMLKALAATMADHYGLDLSSFNAKYFDPSIKYPLVTDFAKTKELYERGIAELVESERYSQAGEFEFVLGNKEKVKTLFDKETQKHRKRIETDDNTFDAYHRLLRDGEKAVSFGFLTQGEYRKLEEEALRYFQKVDLRSSIELAKKMGKQKLAQRLYYQWVDNIVERQEYLTAAKFLVDIGGDIDRIVFLLEKEIEHKPDCFLAKAYTKQSEQDRFHRWYKAILNYSQERPWDQRGLDIQLAKNLNDQETLAKLYEGRLKEFEQGPEFEAAASLAKEMQDPLREKIYSEAKKFFRPPMPG